MSLETGFRDLAAAGLRMQAALAVYTLPEWATAPLAAADIDVSPYRSLVMLGQGGTRLWEYIAGQGTSSDHPFDDTSTALAADFAARHLAGSAWEIVYPGPALLPLGRLAELAGWGRPSPLGLTINPRFGLWLAHRIVFLVDAAIEPGDLAEMPPTGVHPCDACLDKPCVAACPVGAVDASRGFDVEACVGFRLEPGSVCAYQCLARIACPVGAEHRYGPDQMHHHYASGLASIRQHLDSSR